MVVNFRLAAKPLVVIAFASAFYMSCSKDSKIKNMLSRDPFINEKFRERTPLAYQVNQGIAVLSDTVFVLEKPMPVQIYATGELDINLATVSREYLFKSDDVELFFYQPHPSGQATPLRIFTLSWLDDPKRKDNSMQLTKKEITCNSDYDIINKKYNWFISIPWNSLSAAYNPLSERILFDVAVGDNDDGMKQKAKIIWHSKTDPGIHTGHPGLIERVSKTDKDLRDGVITALKRKSTGIIDSVEWLGYRSFPIRNLATGILLRDDDLAATIKSCWDEHSLHLNIEIIDSKKGFVIPEIIKDSPTFHDYGWIEDNKGNVVWKMHALHSHHAGGAIKNQYISDKINLKAGKYHLKYITDESHSWAQWDDKPPKSSFYGIVLYSQK